MIFERPNLPRSPIAPTSAIAAVLVLSASLMAVPAATEMLGGVAGLLVDAVEVAVDSPRASSAVEPVDANGQRMPGGGVLGVGPAGPLIPTAPPQTATAAARDFDVAASVPVLLLLVGANLLAFGRRRPERPVLSAAERYHL
jgi:hypothetical protein